MPEPHKTRQDVPSASIIIPTLGRKECLDICLKSLKEQTVQDYEVIVVTERGPLARLRNEGARRARGEYLIFIDDDVRCSIGWLEEILRVFRGKEGIAGVSGPAVIPQEFRINRDIFRFVFFKWLYDIFFCGGQQHLPGHITPSGAWTTGASLESCDYEGPVDFLEACNMAFRREAFFKLGGFDESYGGVGDWSEPDLSYKLKSSGGCLWFSPRAKLYHCPSRSGAFRKRLDKGEARRRLENYFLFAKRWVRPNLRHYLYKLFLRSYYAITSFK